MKKTLQKQTAALSLICTLAVSCIAFTAPGMSGSAFSQNTIIQAASKQTASAEVSSKKTVKKYTSEDGTVLMEASYEKPILSGNTNAIKKINKFYTKAQKQYFNNYQKYISSNEFIGSNPYGDTLTTNVTYNQSGIISILQEGYFYAGGAHGMPYRVTHTFDLNTGTELKLTDIMKGTNTQIKNRIIKAFKAKLSNFEGAYTDALSTVKKTAGSKSAFYLEKDKITFYYDPYELAPYAAGFVEASIPYTAKDTFQLTL